ncbi:MAG TPA: hypothetical protein GX707_19700 [Epulopiscium sp.]|nr:hypothetical protein [Candidatus Epulonipiscium sp.]
MRFIIKQKILSLSDSFVIHDENNTPVYKVVGKLFAFGDELKIYNMSNEEQIYIEQKLFKLLPEYHLFQKGQRVGIVKKEFTLFKPRFNIESNSGRYTVDGNFFGYNFRVLKEGTVVARADKAFFAFKDTYAVEISPGENEGLLLAICIIIDQTLHDSNHNNH